ncbi:hypothetical protein FRC08_012555 [Ceratobasidium sp. 394]|nr:hypothetical protein FRC08_012555 [Ceratobasidium sp. 394]
MSGRKILFVSGFSRDARAKDLAYEFERYVELTHLLNFADRPQVWAPRALRHPIHSRRRRRKVRGRQHANPRRRYRFSLCPRLVRTRLEDDEEHDACSSAIRCRSVATPTLFHTRFK